MNEHYPFINTPLPYDYQSMEPYIDEKTMYLHHARHLQTYVDNLNAALKDYPFLHHWTLEQLLLNIPSLPPKIQLTVQNNAGGVFNHQFYFSNLLNPAPSQPGGILLEALYKEFGSFQNFANKMKTASLSVFGSGYTWLAVNAMGQPVIITTANQNTPFPLGMCPVLNLDVWEHAYYLKHFNVRADYIEDWFHVINWKQAEENYRKCFHNFY